jgi:GNAT superfamily N-acetyltransferase
MISIKKTNATDIDFNALVQALDDDLKIRDGDDHFIYAQFNKTNTLHHAVVLYFNNQPVGCGALRQYSADTMEIKRVFVYVAYRKKGFASIILNELENWCKELHINNCILETGKNQPEAINLYKKLNYNVVPNFGKYMDNYNSVCFKKVL